MNAKKIRSHQRLSFFEFAASAFFSMIFVTTSLYKATVAGLLPVQLALVGTALEVSAFVFEVPSVIGNRSHPR